MGQNCQFALPCSRWVRVPSRDIEAMRRAIETQYRAKVTVLPAKPLPDEAFTAPRRRWRTEKLRLFLDRGTDRRFERVVGLTTSDISTTARGHRDYGIAGEATIDGRPCVISTYRLKRFATAKEGALRIRQTAIHEVGHTFGLGHCPDKNCVMRDGKYGLSSLPTTRPLFCATCRRKLSGVLQ